jgi:hypothetical protein
MKFTDYIVGNGNKSEEVLQDKVVLFAATQMRNQLTENI